MLKRNDGGKILSRQLANRSALALKALDQRLHAANINKSTTPSPAVAPMVASINTTTEEGTVKDNESKGDGS